MLLPRSYSHHSLLSAVPKIPALIDDAITKGYTTIALTDEDTGSNFIEFYDLCKKKEINGALGVVLRIPNISNTKTGFSSQVSMSKIAILAKSEIGYRALLDYISTARTEQELPSPHITFDNLVTEEFADSCFVSLTGNDHELGSVIRSGNTRLAHKILDTYLTYINAGNVLVELLYPLDSDSIEEVERWNKELYNMCVDRGIRVIASPAPRYLSKDDQEAFRTVLAIRDGKRLGDISLTRDFYLPTVEELCNLFHYIPNISNTSDIENQIDIEFRTDFDNAASEAFFPQFPLDEGQNPQDRLKWEAYIGLFEKFDPKGRIRSQLKADFPYIKLEELKAAAKVLVPDTSQLLGYPSEYWETANISTYIDRIELELDVIINKGYPEYFLVFGDIMQFCRDNGIVINTRGSAAGCLVGYLTNINILDPLLYQLPFERFLNPLRPSAPDIDGDYADDRRQEVIDYITQTYGAEHVCQIITFGTMLPRAVVRDVGRALGVSYKKCDQLSKLIPIAPQGRKASFAWAFETSQELKQVYEQDAETQRIIEIGKRIESNYRHASVHAAGVVITPCPVRRLTPLQWDSDHKMIISQYDMRYGEKAGTIKMDILGIRNLSILGNAIKLTQERRGVDVDLMNIDIQDKKSFELLARGGTMGVFQLSSVGMTKHLMDLEPEKVQDIMAMVALYRPGPMSSIPDYIARKKDPSKVSYLVPQMEGWMKPSFGIFVYQEDLLFTAIELAGYDWGMADMLRKGMGKKIQSVIDEQRPIFVNGCVEHSALKKEQAEEIWSQMVPFGAYGFNKSHSSSYGMVAYWTAYMKANFTAEFMTALMTAENGNLDKIAAAIAECREMGLEVLPPDVNLSHDNFTIENDLTIRYGLSSVKNLGSDVIEYIIEEREKKGEFDDINDFIERISDCSGFTKRSLEALIWGGCFDKVGEKVLSC